MRLQGRVDERRVRREPVKGECLCDACCNEFIEGDKCAECVVKKCAPPDKPTNMITCSTHGSIKSICSGHGS